MHGIAPSGNGPHAPDGRSSCAPRPGRVPGVGRALILTPDYPPERGGIQAVAHHLATGLRAFETRVVALDSPGAAQFDAQETVPVRRVASGRLRGPARNVALNATAVREALAFRPHVTLSAHIVTSPAAAAIRLALGARTVQYYHAREIPAKPRLAAFAAAQADAVIAVSAYSASLLASTGARREHITLIPPGVELPPDGARSRPAARPTLLTISRLEDRYKGHDVLIDALALVRSRVPDVEWIVIGDGRLREGLQALARARGLGEAARFLGSVSDQQRDYWLRRADAFAMPSRLGADGAGGEGFGIVYMEAAAYGKPVVAGNVGGAVDAVADGETGVLVDPSDPLAVADAVSGLLLEPERARRLGRAGAERARRFAWPLIVGRVEAVLLEQLAHSPRFAGARAPADGSLGTPA